MGYTHYYGFKKDSIKKLDENVLAVLRDIAKRYKDILEVEELDENGFSINGIGDDAHETFYVDFGERPEWKSDLDGIAFEFCKTARKPYDLPVCEMLLVLKAYYKKEFSLSSDGMAEYKNPFIELNKAVENNDNSEFDENWIPAFKNVKEHYGIGK